MIDPDAPDLELDDRSGAGPMLATLIGILLTLIGLAVIFYRLFPPNDDAEGATTTSISVAVSDDPADTTTPSSTLSSSTTLSSTTPSSTLPSSTVPSTTVASTAPTSTGPSSTESDPGVDPSIDDVSVDVGSTTADISFTTPTCVNARYDYTGASSGRHEGAGYPDPSSCWTEHLALLGEWTDPLVPGSDYVVEITVVDQQGRTATSEVSFTTAR